MSNQVTNNFEDGTVQGWADAGQSTVGIENGSPIAGSFSLKFERTAAQGTGTVSAQRNITGIGGVATAQNTVYYAQCLCVRTGSNLTTGKLEILIYDVGASLLQTITGPTVNVTSTATLTAIGVNNQTTASIVRARVTSDANALDNGTDRLVIDTFFASDGFGIVSPSGSFSSGNLTGALSTLFIPAPMGPPLLDPQAYTPARATYLRM